MPDLVNLYRFRFKESDLPEKRRIWKTLCKHYFQNLIGSDQVIVDLACGYGEFINNIAGKRKIGVDLNPTYQSYMENGVEFVNCRADALDIPDNTADVVFTSNFLEHLRTKEECDAVLNEVHRVLKPGGRFIIMGPNIRYLSDKYWDFYDHYLPLSHLSVEEGLAQAGFSSEKVIDRFLPYTTRSALPKASALIAIYLRIPLAWPIMGKQFLVVGRKPGDATLGAAAPAPHITHREQFVRFVGVGAFAALVNWLSRIALSVTMPLSYAIIVAYLAGMTVAYTLNRRYVFRSTDSGRVGEYARFALVNVVGLAQVWAVTMALVHYVFPAIDFTWRAEAVAHLIGVASPMFTSYLGHRYFSFRKGDARG